MAARRYVIGNWKMHTTRDAAVALARAVVQDLAAGLDDSVEAGLAPPFPFLEAVGAVCKGSKVVLVAQDCHPEAQGAFTGAVSVPMLASVGVQRVIVGHSERRTLFGETDALVRKKVEAVLAAGLMPVVCVGEKLDERETGRERQVVETQVKAALAGLGAGLQKVIVAYEPVWAIGTGKTATPEQAGAMHCFILELLAGLGAKNASVPVIYGGSVKPGLIAGLAATRGIEGALVGGASLEAPSFVQIVRGVAQATPGARSS